MIHKKAKIKIVSLIIKLKLKNVIKNIVITLLQKKN
jgi:hypothetical protein